MITVIAAITVCLIILAPLCHISGATYTDGTVTRTLYRGESIDDLCMPLVPAACIGTAILKWLLV